jgi:hypothetical protein
MGHGLVIANVDRAGDHAVLLGVVVVIVAVGGLVRAVASRRADRTRYEREHAGASGPGASDRSRDA